jgi:hypothetical protein
MHVCIILGVVDEEGLSRVEEAPTMHRDAGIGSGALHCHRIRRARSRYRRPRMRSARSSTSTMRTPSSLKVARIRSGWASDGCAIFEDTPIITEPRSVGVVGAPACGSVQLGPTDSCSAGKCAAARTSRSRCQLPPWAGGRSPRQASAAHAARRHLCAAGALDRTRNVGRSRVRTSTRRAIPPRAGQPQVR